MRLIEVVSNVIIILIVGLAGSAIGYYSAGYMPKRDVADVKRETIGSAQASPDPFRQPSNPLTTANLSISRASLGQASPPSAPAAASPAALADVKTASLVPKERNDLEARAEAARHKGKVQSRYNSCLQQAEQAFTLSWDESCKSSEEDRRKDYQQCIATAGQSEKTCSRTYAAIPDKNCKLPSKLSEKLGTQLQSKAHRCLLEFQAGLE